MWFSSPSVDQHSLQSPSDWTFFFLQLQKIEWNMQGEVLSLSLSRHPQFNLLPAALLLCCMLHDHHRSPHRLTLHSFGN
jgi:hypothetical protein